jgi:FKBP-type peptidyl-prolyl cis-trans isomerase (trigger factor)
MTRSLLELERFKATLQEAAGAFEARLQAATTLDFPQRLVELKALRDQALAQMQARYQRLPRDFRTYADEAVTAFRANLEERLSHFAKEAPVQERFA